MGQKTLCCSSQQFAQTNCGHKGQSISVTSFSNCTVSLSFGVIFNEDVDCVVVVGNTKLKLGPNTIKQIQQFGGPSVMNELRQVLLDEGGKLDLGRVVYTHAGDMDYEYIFYAVLPNCCDSSVQLLKGSYAFNNHCDDYQPSSSYLENIRIQDGIQVYTEKLGDSVQTHERQNIYECVINCLQKAMELGIQSIALPFMEPSVIHISKSKIVATMLFAIKQFLKENSKCSLTEIRINTQDLATRNLFKYYINQILIDQSESTINELFASEQEQQKQRQSSSFSSQTDNNLNVDDIMKFCHNIKDDTQHNKHKSSF